MRLTDRDATILRDLALSHVLSRDHLLGLGYFGSVGRANARLLALMRGGFVTRLSTPFFAQSLYAAGPLAAEVVGPRVAGLINRRTGSPRFLRHALAVTETRLHLLRKAGTSWRFEQQAWAAFQYGGRTWEVRPDGMAVRDGRLLAVEVDMGHVAPSKFAAKLRAYDAFARSGECRDAWGADTFSLFVVTAGGKLRASRLARLAPRGGSVPAAFETFERLGIPLPGMWS